METYTPRTEICDPDLPAPVLTEVLREISEDEMFNEDVLHKLATHFLDTVFRKPVGQLTFETTEVIGHMTSAYCISKEPDDHKIGFARSCVNTKQLLYQTMAHELCHAYIQANGTHRDRKHGNIFIKTCEKFLQFDPAMHIYMPSRSSPDFPTFIYECSNEDCRDIIARKAHVSECEKCMGELICV